MTRDTFLGRMDDDSPRGFIPTRPTQTPASNSTARKRMTEGVPTLEEIIANHAWGYSDAGEWRCYCGDFPDVPQYTHLAQNIRAHVAAGGAL